MAEETTREAEHWPSVRQRELATDINRLAVTRTSPRGVELEEKAIELAHLVLDDAESQPTSTWRRTVTYEWQAGTFAEAEEVWSQDGPECGPQVKSSVLTDMQAEALADAVMARRSPSAEGSE
jgi:hypothetical protein